MELTPVTSFIVGFATIVLGAAVIVALTAAVTLLRVPRPTFEWFGVGVLAGGLALIIAILIIVQKATTAIPGR